MKSQGLKEMTQIEPTKETESVSDVVDGTEDDSEETGSVKIYKKYFDILDKENYEVFVCENKIVFNSTTTDTHLCIATVNDGEEE